MARRHYWQFLVTDEGNPIENAEITIYIAGTEDPAYIYNDEVGGLPTNSAPQTFTSRKGYFEFWVADTTETNGYFFNQKFKIAWSAPGVSKGFVDFVDVFSTSVAEVDETSTDPLKNKAVSNLLAKGWEDHKNSILYTDALVEVHGITAVDEASYDGSNPENTKLNKLVSNVLGNNWEGHANTIYDVTNDAWYYTIAGGPLEPVDGLGGPGNPHGIDFVDTSSTDTEKNRLISNELGKQWHDHRTNVAAGSADHTQFPLLDGTRSFTDPVGYTDGTVADTAGPDDFITKGFVDGAKFAVTIPTTSWTDNGDGTYSFDVVHGLSTDYPVVMLWNTDISEAIQPLTILNVDTTTITLTVTDDINAFVRVVV